MFNSSSHLAETLQLSSCYIIFSTSYLLYMSEKQGYRYMSKGWVDQQSVLCLREIRVNNATLSERPYRPSCFAYQFLLSPEYGRRQEKEIIFPHGRRLNFITCEGNEITRFSVCKKWFHNGHCYQTTSKLPDCERSWGETGFGVTDFWEISMVRYA